MTPRAGAGARRARRATKCRVLASGRCCACQQPQAGRGAQPWPSQSQVEAHCEVVWSTQPHGRSRRARLRDARAHTPCEEGCLASIAKRPGIHVPLLTHWRTLRSGSCAPHAWVCLLMMAAGGGSNGSAAAAATPAAPAAAPDAATNSRPSAASAPEGRADGLAEEALRSHGAELVQTACLLLRAPHVVAATGCILLHVALDRAPPSKQASRCALV